jgi:hypothetical protein
MRKIQPRFIYTSFFLVLMCCLPSAAQVATGTPPFGAGGQHFHATEAKAYLLRVPHSSV